MRVDEANALLLSTPPPPNTTGSFPPPATGKDDVLAADGDGDPPREEPAADPMSKDTLLVLPNRPMEEGIVTTTR